MGLRLLRDIVLLDKDKKIVVLLELTVPFDSSLECFKAAQVRKTDRYDRLSLEMKALGYMAHNIPWYMWHHKCQDIQKDVGQDCPGGLPQDQPGQEEL